MIGRSAHREEYVRLLENGWTSMALERYAAHRYGEDIPASTFRAYRKRAKIETPVSKFGEVADPESLVDVLSVRSELIQMQRARIAIDTAHETAMKKLFGSTRGEIDLLSKLLDSHKGDLQDLGLMPKAGDLLTVNQQPGPELGDAPRHRSLADALGTDPAHGPELAKVLHMALKKTGTENATTNRHGE